MTRACLCLLGTLNSGTYMQWWDNPWPFCSPGWMVSCLFIFPKSSFQSLCHLDDPILDSFLYVLVYVVLMSTEMHGTIGMSTTELSREEESPLWTFENIFPNAAQNIISLPCHKRHIAVSISSWIRTPKLFSTKLLSTWVAHSMCWNWSSSNIGLCTFSSYQYQTTFPAWWDPSAWHQKPSDVTAIHLHFELSGLQGCM